MSGQAPTSTAPEAEGQGEPKKEDRRGLARKLIEAVTPRLKLYKSIDGQAYARMPVNGGHSANYRIRSSHFKAFLTTFCLKRFHTPPGRAVLETVTVGLEGLALVSDEVEQVYVRHARIGNVIYIDLCTPTWECVEVTAEGWNVIQDPPVRFTRSSNLAPFPVPSKSGNISLLRPFLNVTSDDDWKLVVAWIVMAMSGQGPFPILLALGSPGSAKTTFGKVLKKLTDPVHRAPLRSLWRNEHELMIAAKSSAVLGFDNLSKLSGDQSDAACRVATGTGFGARILYTDEDENTFDGMRPMIMNGITEFATRSDFLDRCLVQNLPLIDPANRRTDAEFWADFNAVWPRVFGGLLDALCVGLKNLPSVRLESLPRMADFMKWVVACEPALPWPSGDFEKTYTQNQSEALTIALEDDLVAQAVINLMESNSEWCGTSTDLFTFVVPVDASQEELKGWPRSPSVLAGRLRRIVGVLRSQGITVTFSRDKLRREIRISRG